MVALAIDFQNAERTESGQKEKAKIEFAIERGPVQLLVTNQFDKEKGM